MGLSPFGSSSNYYEAERQKNSDIKTPNPNPNNFKIIKSEQVGNNVVVVINYPNCTNCEGNKICVFKDTDISEIASLPSIDPHFTIGKFSPFARFKPSQEGWVAAIIAAGKI